MSKEPLSRNRHPNQISNLFLLNSLDIGGSERKIVRVANALSSRGRSIGIAYLNPPEELIGEILPDIATFHLEREGKISRTALANLKRIINRHSITRILSVNLFPALYLAILRLGGIRFDWTALLNTTDFENARQAAGMLIFTPSLYLADKYVFGSRYQATAWKKRYRLSAEKSSYIHNGIDTAFFTPDSARVAAKLLRETCGIPPDSPVIGTVGRMRPEKSQHLILGAAANLQQAYPDLHIVLVGDGERRQFLETRAVELGLSDRTHFLGNLLDVRPALALMDIFILPSTSVETFSNAALEAMAIGKPLILSDISGAREMLEDGVNGFIVQPGNLDELTCRIGILLDDPVKAGEMGERSRRRAELEFSFQIMTDNYERLINMDPETA